MRLHKIILLVAFSLPLLQSPVIGAQLKAPPKVGLLSPFLGRENSFFETIRDGLQKLGYVEGKSITFIYRQAESFDELTVHAVEMSRLKVDVIVTDGAQGTRAAKNATRAIPIVMADVGDAVNQGFVTSLAKPGGNITGLSSLNAELSAKRLELVKEILPAVARVAVIREAVGDATPLHSIEVAAQALAIRLIILQVRDGDEVPNAFTAMTSARAGALQVMPGSLFVSRLKRVTELSASARLPAVYADSRFVDSGGLVSYGPNVRDHYRRAALYVDRIVKGVKPGELPVEQPTAFELSVNLKTAESLRLSLPSALLARANHVVR